LLYRRFVHRPDPEGEEAEVVPCHDGEGVEGLEGREGGALGALGAEAQVEDLQGQLPEPLQESVEHVLTEDEGQVGDAPLREGGREGGREGERGEKEG
jgi:hypothetical protein